MLHADSSAEELAVAVITTILTEDAQAAFKAKQAAVKFSLKAPCSHTMNMHSYELGNHVCSICGKDIGFDEMHASLDDPDETAHKSCHIGCVPTGAIKVGTYIDVKYMGHDPDPTA